MFAIVSIAELCQFVGLPLAIARNALEFGFVKHNRCINVKVKHLVQIPRFFKATPGIAQAGRETIIRIRQVTPATRKLVLPRHRGVEIVEDIGTAILSRSRIPRLLAENIKIGFNHMGTGIINPTVPARCKGHTNLPNRAEHVTTITCGTLTPQIQLSRLIPIGTAKCRAGDNRQDVVRHPKRCRQAVVGIDAKRVIVTPQSRICAEDRRLASRIFGITAIQPSNTVLAFVINRKPKQRRGIDIKEELRQALGRRVEIV